MKTSVKIFNNIPVSSRPLCEYKYTDFVSYVAFVSVLPFALIEAVVIAPFVGLMLVISRCHMDCISVILEFIIRTLATVMSYVFRFIGYGISIVLCGVHSPLIMYAHNQSIIKAMNPVSLRIVDFSKLPVVHRNAIAKNGFIAVLWRIVIMFSILHILRSY